MTNSIPENETSWFHWSETEKDSIAAIGKHLSKWINSAFDWDEVWGNGALLLDAIHATEEFWGAAFADNMPLMNTKVVVATECGAEGECFTVTLHTSRKEDEGNGIGLGFVFKVFQAPAGGYVDTFFFKDHPNA